MTTTEPSSPGRIVNDRYRLLEPIGQGGMGEVWLADDTLLDRRVALKSLLLGAFPDAPEMRKRAFREAKALARVRHPGIVGIHDVFFADDDPWIVMEFVQGVSLADLLAERDRLPERDAARTALALLDALDVVHRNGVVHRDLKPANVLVEDDGRVRLIDFGIAYVGGASRVTSTGQVVGTAEYMAPERIRDADLGPAADLWSLGVVLFEALEGRSPFRRDGGADAPWPTLWAVMNEPPPRPVSSGRLTDAVLRLLEKDPAARLTSEDLRRTLRTVLASRPGPPRVPTGDRPFFRGGTVGDDPPTREDPRPRGDRRTPDGSRTSKGRRAPGAARRPDDRGAPGDRRPPAGEVGEPGKRVAGGGAAARADG
ncbi:hypothetical protein BJF79_30510 [Actinomadura sp. CNU-125]|uniref:serine/threonine-protein kinase n=1 Tax=Actinomadura sp. CNU-125 TaxID=1904961 RepID=UPI0009599DC4|nr:serine/threonine-protein kinase [Actinomadura sp. CNU-125]OLT36887.1 hypothetical protein BJF79_30510 [Actinomadura sp. CNU-125]